ncbi:MAG: serine hydrolase [bacterium]|nr:serine hydrolase [bacterium]
MRRIILIVLLLFFVFFAAAGVPAQDGMAGPSEAEIKKIIKKKVDKYDVGFGIVVGIVNEKERKIISYGTLRKGGKEVDRKTVFELGSVTKTFTGILLADMVERRMLNLDDPIEKFLPQSVKVPQRNGRKITLLDLAAHTSGLPGNPRNPARKDNKPGYVGYTEQKLYDYLSNYTLTRDIGSKWEYSNMGMGLLGHILSRKAGKSYDELVIESICRPLGMDSTRRELSAGLRARRAVGVYLDGQESKGWQMPTVFAGAGGFRSTAEDMLKYLAGNMGLVKSPVLTAMQKSHIGRKRIKGDAIKNGLAWMVIRTDDLNLLLHTGGTGANSSFIGFDPVKKTGVVVLTNSNCVIEDIGLYALTGKFEILKLGEYKEPEMVQVDPAVYDAYVGKYQTTPSFFLTFTTENGRFFVQGTGQPRFELFPQSESKFFLKAVRGTITFVKDDEGKVIHAVIHSSEGEEISKKID